MTTRQTSLPGDTWHLGDLTVTRFGYGAMQLTGPGVLGPPADRGGALDVLRAAVELGITHIDTADVYGPRVVNDLIREALHPYPASLHIATKVGATRDAAGNWPTAREPDEIRRAVHDNLDALGVDALDVVNLRMGDATGPQEGSLARPFETVLALREEGLIRHLGVSNVTAAQVEEARRLGPIVCVQNMYNLAFRHDDDLIDELHDARIAYVPFFPLGGFTPVQADDLVEVATAKHSTPIAISLAWLLQRSPNILVIPGTSSVAHLRENVARAAVALDDDDLAALDRIGRSGG
ncbi:oxidoreductase [uncultured Williamsia sp.]|uniref:oxidoreductase n=1 Tax=uncultured Williamsia sp. TaxID=259311 RepID=UPI0026300748|nr:oxidoreductase [uncultured Williamsia sp.]